MITLLEQVEICTDKNCTIQIGKYDVRVYKTKTSYKKGQVVNPFGGVFGMRTLSGKNNLNKILATHRYGISTYYYSIVVEGKTVYFKINQNLEAL